MTTAVLRDSIQEAFFALSATNRLGIGVRVISKVTTNSDVNIWKQLVEDFSGVLLQ